MSTNYDAAWAGFDVLLTLTLASTAYFALRRSRYLATAASATATLLVVDAWFDVLTTPGVQRIESIGAGRVRGTAAGGGVHLAELAHPAAGGTADRVADAPLPGPSHRGGRRERA